MGTQLTPNGCFPVARIFYRPLYTFILEIISYTHWRQQCGVSQRIPPGRRSIVFVSKTSRNVSPMRELVSIYIVFYSELIFVNVAYDTRSIFFGNFFDCVVWLVFNAYCIPDKSHYTVTLKVFYVGQLRKNVWRNKYQLTRLIPQQKTAIVSLFLQQSLSVLLHVQCFYFMLRMIAGIWMDAMACHLPSFFAQIKLHTYANIIVSACNYIYWIWVENGRDLVCSDVIECRYSQNKLSVIRCAWNMEYRSLGSMNVTSTSWILNTTHRRYLMWNSILKCMFYIIKSFQCNKMHYRTLNLSKKLSDSYLFNTRPVCAV